MSDLFDRVSGTLPGWIIDRAAAYMLRCYGRGATIRAAARHRALLEQGEHQAAADWLRVAEEIDRLVAAQVRRLRKHPSAQPGISGSGCRGRR